MKKKKKIKLKNLFILILFIVCCICLVISLINIIIWGIDRSNNNKQEQKIDKLVKIKEISDSDKTKIIEQAETPKKSNPYWDYIKINMINVDFSKLKDINNDVQGWIQVKGTNINYPFVQAKNNDFYLTHSFDKSYNQAGWVFMDYRNDIKDIHKNTILYAHGRIDTTMFGSLKNILKSKWYNNPNNYVIKLSTEYENTLWQVFSVYKIDTTNDYLQIDFNSDNYYQEFLNMLINRSHFNFNTTINKNDHILTLSTCYNNTQKVVMHAKLIKQESK